MAGASNFSVWFYDLFEMTRDEKKESLANETTKHIFFELLFPGKTPITKIYKKLLLNDYVVMMRLVEDKMKEIKRRNFHMLKGALVKLLEKYPDDMIVKFRFGPLTLGDINYVTTSSFIEDPGKEAKDVIVLENVELKNGKYSKL